MKWVRLVVAASAVALTAGAARSASTTTPIRVAAAAETSPVPHSGDAADDAAIWVAGASGGRSVVIGTDKNGGLGVYDLAGRKLHYYGGITPNNVDLRGGFQLGRERVVLVAISETTSDEIRFFALDPVSRGLRPLVGSIATGIGVSGLCMYRDPKRLRLYAFVSDSSGTVQQWELRRAEGGVDGRKVRTLRLASTTEGCVADDPLRRLYVSEEDVALWRYGADPSAGSSRVRVDSVGAGHLTADIEGLAIYRIKATGGYLIASSQGSDSFAVYRRRSNARVFDFAIGGGAIDEVTHTDGIDATSATLGRPFPHGLFVAQDDSDDSGHQNFKLVDWRALERASGGAIGSGRSASQRSRGPRTFYVDAIAGNDAAAGTAPGAAWRTLRRATAALLEPGDRLLLRRGRTWSEPLRVDSSGNSRARIVVGGYGRGPRPIIRGQSSCVRVTGSYVVVRELHADDCSWAGVEVLGGHVRVERSVLSHNVAGVDVKAGSVGAQVVDNDIVDNNKMSVLTASPTNDDSGAFGVALHGDDGEVAFNRISGSDAFSYDFGRDGAAVEVYGGQRNNVHHNLATENHDFSELGNPRSADNTFAYNLVRSSLPSSTFLITRGGQTSLGPVLRTRAFNNTVYFTGASSQGFVCYAGCSAAVLTMRNNLIQAVWKVGYADAAFDEDHDLFYGGILQFTKGAHSLVANPDFLRPPSNLRLRRSSPAVDRGVRLGYRYDLDRHAASVDGNRDGHALPDAGAYEFKPR